MSVVSWRSVVHAAELHVVEVDGDAVSFGGDASPRSWSDTERENLPRAVAPGRTYRRVRVDLRIEAEIDAPG